MLSMIWSKLAALLQWVGIANKGKKLIDSFPGIGDQEQLRLWVLAHADAFQPIVASTANKIDDAVLLCIRRVALNAKAFSAVYNLLHLAYEWVPLSGSEPAYGCEKEAARVFMASLDDGELVENPMLVISVAGLLLQLIMLIRARQRG